MNKNSSIWTINEQGNILFNTHDEVLKKTYKPRNIFEYPIMSYLVMILCALLDFIMFKQLFGSFLYDDLAIQYLSIVGLLIAFDFAPIYLGMKLKDKSQGYNVKKIVIIILLASFLIGIILNFILRFEFKDMVLSDLSNYKISFMGDISMEETQNPHALTYAWFGAIIPIATSLCSFGVSYVTSNPLQKELRNLEETKLFLEKDLLQTDSILKEYETDSIDTLKSEEEEKYQQTKLLIKMQALEYCDYVRERLKEHIGNPTSSSALSEFDYENIITKIEALDSAI